MTELLLASVLARSDAEAAAAWIPWRRSTHLDDLTWSDALLIPMIPRHRFRRLVDGDPGAPILDGLARRAWTHGMVRTEEARDMRRHLTAAGLGPIILGGSVAAFLHLGDTGVIRPVTEIVLFVPRRQVEDAIRVMASLGARPDRPIPALRERSWVSGIPLRRGDTRVRLAWRHVASTPWRAASAELALMARAEEVLPPEPLLLSRLADRGTWDDPVPWQADVAVLAARPLDWAAVYRDGAIWAPEVHDRLELARSTIAGIPAPTARRGVATYVEQTLDHALRQAVVAARAVVTRT